MRASSRPSLSSISSGVGDDDLILPSSDDVGKILVQRRQRGGLGACLSRMTNRSFINRVESKLR